MVASLLPLVPPATLVRSALGMLRRWQMLVGWVTAAVAEAGGGAGATAASSAGPSLGPGNWGVLDFWAARKLVLGCCVVRFVWCRTLLRWPWWCSWCWWWWCW